MSSEEDNNRGQCVAEYSPYHEPSVVQGFPEMWISAFDSLYKFFLNPFFSLRKFWVSTATYGTIQLCEEIFTLF